MDPRKPRAAMTTDELEELLKDAVTPVDLGGLMRAGVLEKQGSWYVIRNWKELPPH